MALIPRHLARVVRRTLATSRVVNIVGPRQDGKSTLVRDLIRSAAYLTLDDDTVRRALAEDPFNQLKSLSEEAPAELPIVIDEIQRLPELTLSLKRLVDEQPRPGRFLLTGSSDIFSHGKSLDSLAGRIATLVLRPFSAAETVGAGPCRLLDAVARDPADPMRLLPAPVPFDRREVIDLIVKGGFPELRRLDDRDRADRFVNYIDSVIERDLAVVHPVRKPDAVRRLIYQASVRTAQELNASALATVLGVKLETIQAYIDALSRLGLVTRLGAWASARARREIKLPKLHVMDTGLAAALRGDDADSFGVARDPAALAALFESFVYTELEKSLPFQEKRWSLWHWRAEKREIDILAEAPGGLIALFEIKSSAKVGPDDFRHIDWFFKAGPGSLYRGVGFVVYLGAHVLSFGPGRIALPASIFWSFPTEEAAAQ